MSKQKHQRLLPAKPLFGGLTKTDTPEDDLETKKVWQQRVLTLLDTPLHNINLSKIEDFKTLQETYPDLEGMTLGDLIHLQQILKAAHGDTKAYTAIDKAVGAATETKKTSDLTDPFMRMCDVLEQALGVARKQVPLDSEMDDMFGDQASNIIEVVIEPEEVNEDE